MTHADPAPRRTFLPARGDWAGWLLLGALALLAALLLLKLLDTATIMRALFNWPFQHDESESMIVSETLLLDHGTNIYANLTPQQFIAAPYPPLYYLLNWPFIHLLGPTFKAGRAITIAATSGAGLLIYALGLRLMRDPLAALLAALTWAALDMVAFWGSLVKPDMLSVTFGLAGLLWVIRAAEARWPLWGALPFFWAAFYSKQTAIAAGVAACAWLLLRNRRTGVAFAAAYAAGAAVGYLLLDWLTAGGYFYHEFTLHDLPWDSDRFLLRLTDWFSTYWPLLLPGVVGIAVSLISRRPSPPPPTVIPSASTVILSAAKNLGSAPTVILIAAYLAMGIVVSSGAGTLGGNHNHLLDLTAACCIGVAPAVALLRRAGRPAARLLGAVAVLAVCTQVPELYRIPHWLGHDLRLPTALRAEGMANVAQYTSNTPGAVYSTDLSLLLATGKWLPHLWTTDPYTQTHAAGYRRWDESALLQAVRERRFALVVVPYSLEDPALDATGDLSPNMVKALQESYRLDQRNVLYIYKPK
ncbi:MAG: glycosyltransferase family 39 protein [Chloroflexia bacterium]